MPKIYPKRTKAILNNETPVIKSGYTGNTVKTYREIGEIWEDDDGNVWEQKNGYTAKIRIADPAIPLFCTCGRIMNRQADTKTFIKNGMCLDCTVERDTELIKQGKFKEYENHRISTYAEQMLIDARAAIGEYLDSLNNIEYMQVDENQKMIRETWNVDDISTIRERLEAELEIIEKELQNLKSENV